MFNKPGESLNTYLKWQHALPLLGLDISPNMLPAVGQCPLCGQTALHVYNDITLGGAWHYCIRCNFKGDTVELAAQVWNTSPHDVFYKMADAGLQLPDKVFDVGVVDKYIACYIDYRKRFWDFWERARRRLALQDTEQIARLQGKLLGRKTVTNDVWAERGGRFVGACHYYDAIEVFQPQLAVNHRENGRMMNAGKTRIFIGRGWGDVLVLPFFQLPGKFHGFMFVGREADGPEDIAFKLLDGVRGSNPDHPRYDSGLLMHDVLHNQHPQFGAEIFVLEDPLAALKIQMRHLQTNKRPLPICAGFSRERIANRHIWKALPARPHVFWAPEVTPNLLFQARNADGRIAVSKGLAYIATDPTKRRPIEWLNLMQKQAIHWRDALEQYIRDHDPISVKSTMDRLDMSVPELRDFLGGCTEDSRDKLTQIISIPPPASNQIKIGGKTILELAGTWCGDNGDLICDTTIRINTIVYYPDSDRTIYEGVVSRNGEQVEFAEIAEVVENKPLNWLRKLLAKNGKGRPKIPNHHWKNRLLSIAQEFHEPESVIGIDSFGWNENQFIFPQFKIMNDGHVVREAARYEPGRFVPAQGLEPPEEVIGTALTALSRNHHAVATFWATTACVVHNLLSGVMGHSKTGIALLGTGAQVVGQGTASAHGCCCTTIPTGYSINNRLDKLTEACELHQWPVAIELGDTVDNKTIAAWLARPAATNSMPVVREYQAHALMINGGWQVIECNKPPSGTNTLEKAGAAILPAYLQNLAERRFRLPRMGAPILNVLHDLKTWFGKLSGDDSVFVNSMSKIHVADQDGNAVEHLMRLVYLGRKDKKLPAVKHGFDPPDPVKAPAIVYTDNAVHLSKDKLTALVAVRGGPLLDRIKISMELQAAGVLLNDSEQFWVLDSTFWNEQLIIINATTNSSQGGINDAIRQRVR
jgi:hypothetical protein